jgi:hypothetical protein
VPKWAFAGALTEKSSKIFQNRRNWLKNGVSQALGIPVHLALFHKKTAVLHRRNRDDFQNELLGS